MGGEMGNGMHGDLSEHRLGQVRGVRLVRGARGKGLVLAGACGVALALAGSSLYGWRLPVLPIEWWVLLPGLVIALLIFTFVQEGTIEPIEARRYLWERLETASEAGRVPSRYQLALLGRVWLFPAFLTAYLVYILIEQTQVWDLHTAIWFLILNKQFLLVGTILSGVIMLFGEQYDSRFERRGLSIWSGLGLRLLSIFLSMIGGYIVLQQVLELGTIGIVIANIVIVLLYLVGVLLAEEE